MLAYLSPLKRGMESWRWYRHFFRDPLGCLEEAQKQFGPVSVFENPMPGKRHGQRYMLAVGAAFNREVLRNSDNFRPAGQVLNGPPGSAQQRLRYNIFRMHREEHRFHRRAMQPPFSKNCVASMVPLMATLIDQALDRWQVGETRDILDEMLMLSNWVAANTLFGNEDFSGSVRLGRMIDHWLLLDAETRKKGMIELDLPGTPYRRELRHAEALQDAILDLIAQKRRAGLASNDVLTMLIRAADCGDSDLSDDDLVAHSVALYGASFETTANALAWTLFLIAQHPACAAQLHDEVSRGLCEWPPDDETLDALPLLDAVIRESMRLAPPVPMTFRTVTHPIELAGVQLRKRDKVVLSHYLSHRDPHIFADPGRFDPSRWFKLRPDPYQYMPFSVGARLCIGAAFAMAELKLVVARVMQRFRLSVVPGTRIDPVVRLVLKPEKGLPMTIHPQDRAFSRSPVQGRIAAMIDLTSAELDFDPLIATTTQLAAGEEAAGTCPHHAA